MTEPVGALAVAGTMLALAIARLAWGALRLVADLRLAQVAALLLAQV